MIDIAGRPHQGFRLRGPRRVASASVGSNGSPAPNVANQPPYRTGWLANPTLHSTVRAPPAPPRRRQLHRLADLEACHARFVLPPPLHDDDTTIGALSSVAAGLGTTLLFRRLTWSREPAASSAGNFASRIEVRLYGCAFGDTRLRIVS